MVGDIYEVDAALVPVLDEIEEIYPGQASLFVRTDQPVESESGLVSCHMYPVAESAIAGLALIAEGDWVTYRRQRGWQPV